MISDGSKTFSECNKVRIIESSKCTPSEYMNLF